MSTEEYKLSFAPGAFDDFEGTQEELDTFVQEIQDLAKSGELFDICNTLDMDILEEQDPELYELLSKKLNSVRRMLH